MSTQRKNITQPAEYWEAFQAAAKSKGMSLSEWMADCCLAQIRSRDMLPERKKRGRPRAVERR